MFKLTIRFNDIVQGSYKTEFGDIHINCNEYKLEDGFLRAIQASILRKIPNTNTFINTEPEILFEFIRTVNNIREISIEEINEHKKTTKNK